MKEYKEEILEFFKNKKFIIILVLVCILSYGFAITNFSIGVDDLSLDRYVSDTYILSQGRWGTFLVYNILQIREFTPFWLDFMVVLVLFITAIVLCAFIKRVSGNKLKESSYILMACGFISCPIISYFFVWQPTKLTVALSNLLILISMIILYEKFIKLSKIKFDIISILLITFSISMYEACAQTFLCLMFITSFIYIVFNKDMKFKELTKFYLNCILNLLIGIIFYYLIKLGLYKILEWLGKARTNYAVSNNILMVFNDVITNVYPMSVATNLISSKFSSMLTNNVFVYFTVVCLIGLVISIIQSIKTKNKKIFIIYFCATLTNYILLVYIFANLYRVCYSWAIMIGFAFCYINEFFKFNKNYIITFIIGYLILMQSKTMNNLFYNEYQNYQKDKDYITNVIYELQDINENIEEISILFVYEENSSNQNVWDNYKYSREDYLEWALTAFEEDSAEIVKFFENLGYEITVVEDREQALEAYENLSDDEKKENVIELEDFVVVKIY